MEEKYKNEDLQFLLDQNNNYVKISNEITCYDIDNLINKENIEDLICPICFYILKDPISCSKKNNSHTFCKECIDKYLQENNNCPTCKLNFEYNKNKKIIDELNKLSFNCAHKNEGCNVILSYSEYLSHFKNCKFHHDIYECQIKKYNYKKKEFDICSYTNDKINMEKHLKICGLSKYKCLFCNENIFIYNLEKHNCKFGIIKEKNGDLYIGEKRNNLKEGYGTLYYSNGTKYEGEFKNNKKEGYGIFYNRTGDKFEGEFKNDFYEGYGIFNFLSGLKFEGQFKDNNINGYGILSYVDGSIFEGEFKNNYFDRCGILYYIDGGKYEGDIKNGFKNGYGILYYKDGSRYEGEFRNDKCEGKGILYYKDGKKYIGEFYNNIRMGYGILYYNNGNRYEGGFKKNLVNGYGLLFYSDGRIYEGKFKNNKCENLKSVLI